MVYLPVKFRCKSDYFPRRYSTCNPDTASSLPTALPFLLCPPASLLIPTFVTLALVNIHLAVVTFKLTHMRLATIALEFVCIHLAIIDESHDCCT